MLATEDIGKDDEVYIDYLYDVEDADTEPWYRELYARTDNTAEEGDDEGE